MKSCRLVWVMALLCLNAMSVFSRAEDSGSVENHLKTLTVKTKSIVSEKKEEEFRKNSKTHLSKALAEVMKATAETYPIAQRNLLETLKRVSVESLVDHKSLVDVLETSPDKAIRSEAHRLQVLIAAAKKGGLGVKDPEPLPSMEAILAFSRLIEEVDGARKACFDNSVTPGFAELDKSIRESQDLWKGYQSKIASMQTKYNRLQARIKEFDSRAAVAEEKFAKARKAYQEIVYSKEDYPKAGEKPGSELTKKILQNAQKIRPIIEEIFVLSGDNVDEQARSIAESFIIQDPAKPLMEYYKVSSFEGLMQSTAFTSRLEAGKADWPKDFKSVGKAWDDPFAKIFENHYDHFFYLSSPTIKLAGLNIAKLEKLDRLNASLKNSEIRKEAQRREGLLVEKMKNKLAVAKIKEERRKFLRSQDLPAVAPEQLKNMQVLAGQKIAKLSELKRSLGSCQAKLDAADKQALRIHASVKETPQLEAVKKAYSTVIAEKKDVHNSVQSTSKPPLAGSNLP